MALIAWKCTRFGRLLQPKVKRTEVQLEDLLEPADEVDQHHAALHGHDVDFNLNPVLQARMVLEAEQNARGRGALRPGARGALGRLLKNVGGTFRKKDDAKAVAREHKRDQIRALDRKLEKEAKTASKKGGARHGHAGGIS